MPETDRDISILEHIISYCDDIDDAVKRFGDEYEVFCIDKEYRNSCALCILQIGELVGHLSESFKKRYSAMPWNQIKAMRNVVAHTYGSIRVETTWETIKGDIPELRAYCKKIVCENKL